MKTKKKVIVLLVMALFMVAMMSITAFAAEGDVAGAVEDTWIAARGQIKTVVNNVIFPVIDLVLAVLFFIKVATAYLDYRKHGQFEWTAPAILAKAESLDKTIEDLRYRFGKKIIRNACLLNNPKMSPHDNPDIIMPTGIPM